MFSEADIQRVADDLAFIGKMFTAPFNFHVGECDSVFGPSLLICGSITGVGSARVVMGVDAWARIANNPSPVARGCMWSCALMDQILSQVHHEWNLVDGVDPEDDKDDDD